MGNDKEYAGRLLTLCTNDQLAVFKRMYPNEPTNDQLPKAISQLEGTLRKDNGEVADLKDTVRIRSETIKTQDVTISGYQKDNAILQEEILTLSEQVNSLTPDTTFTVCRNCVHHQVTDKTRPDNWANNVCDAIVNSTITNPVTGLEEYEGGYKHPYCRDVNTVGACPYYEGKSDEDT